MTVAKYAASTACAWGLTLSGAAFGVAGILALFIASPALNVICVIALAAMTAFAVACANFAAAAAMHAASGLEGRVHWPTFWPALALTLIFAFGSAGGVHLGWLVLAAMAPDPTKLPDAHLVDLAALVLCIAKPAMTWITEGRSAIDVLAARQTAERLADEARRDADRERDRIAATERLARLAAQPDHPPAPLVAKAPEPARATKRRVSDRAPIRRATAAVALATIGAVASPAAAQPAPATTTLVDETGAVAALRNGRSLRSVQRDFGLTYDKVRKLKAALDAGKL